MWETSLPLPFSGVRFVLSGFDPAYERQVRSKLVEGGGVDVGQYSHNSTHVIVDKIVYDDTLCVAAREDGKIMVTGLWVDHSFDVSIPADVTSIMYRPLKDLNGIPGAKNLIMCLTGYQRQDRDDIMTMVDLMGAQFSKPLVANKVTHLICYKFEGEKYELAKKIQTIKLVNHYWLEDCLREGEILSESSYAKSAYELEMLGAEARDSEDDDEDRSLKELREESINKSPCIMKTGTTKASELSVSVGETSRRFPDLSAPSSLNFVSTKGLLSTPRKENRSDQVLGLDGAGALGTLGCQDVTALTNATCVHPPNLYEKTPVSIKVGKDMESSSGSAKNPSRADSNLNLRTYLRKNSGGSPLSRCSGDTESNLNRYSKDEFQGFGGNDVCDIFLSNKEHIDKRDVSGSGEAPQQSVQLLQKWKMSDACTITKSQKTNNEENCVMRSPLANEKTQVLEKKSLLDYTIEIDKNGKDDKQDGKTPQTSLGRLKKPTSPSKQETGQSGIGKSPNTDENGHSRRSDVEDCSLFNKSSEIESSNGPTNSDFLGGGNGSLIKKPLKQMIAAKKTLGSRSKLSSSPNRKGSTYLNKTTSQNGAASGQKSGNVNVCISKNMKSLLQQLIFKRWKKLCPKILQILLMLLRLS